MPRLWPSARPVCTVLAKRMMTCGLDAIVRHRQHASAQRLRQQLHAHHIRVHVLCMWSNHTVCTTAVFMVQSHCAHYWRLHRTRRQAACAQHLFDPLANALIAWRLHPAYWARYRPNVRKLRASWEAIAREAYERPMEEGSTAFWACVRRAYPEALTDRGQWEHAVTSISLIYAAGSETTANGVGVILAALATDAGSRRALEAVRQA